MIHRPRALALLVSLDQLTRVVPAGPEYLPGADPGHCRRMTERGNHI